MSDLTLLPQWGRGRHLGLVWSRLVNTASVPQLLGMLCLTIAAATVGCGLVPGFMLPGPVALALFWAVLGVLLLVGSWMILAPGRSREVLIATLVAAPVLWTMMLFTWDDRGRLLSPVALIFVGATAAVFCSGRVVFVQAVLAAVAAAIWVDRVSDTTYLVAPRVLVHLLTVALFTTVVYSIRRRAIRVREEFRSRSVIDALTGLPNRRHVESVAGQTLASARRQDREVFTLVVDIDRLREINARYGSAAGDQVITRVAAVVRATLRPEDLLARVGGEEVLALGLVRSQFEAVRVAERLRRAVRKASLPVPVTCSIGVATARPGGGMDPVEWVWNLAAVAEESLAAAKASGRDRVVAARQSGDVLGDALTLITARAAGPSVLAETRPDPRWTSPTVTARLVAGLGVFSVLLMAWYLAVGNVAWQSGWSLAAAVAAVLIGLGSISLLIWPMRRTGVVAAIVLGANLLWVAAPHLSRDPDGYVGPMTLMVASGVAAWLFRPPLLVVQMLVTYPMLWLVLRHTGIDGVDATLEALLHGTALNIAAVGLYLLRRHGEDVIAASAAMATTDQLTGMPNRRYLEERAAAIVAGAARQQLAVAAVVVDIDDFWVVNDSYGFAAGDQALVEAGKAVSRVLRPEDTVVRMGGDEFVIVGINDEADARRTADRVRTAMSSVWVAEEMPLSCSVGVALDLPAPQTQAVPWLMRLVADAAEDLRIGAVEARAATAEV